MSLGFRCHFQTQWWRQNSVCCSCVMVSLFSSQLSARDYPQLPEATHSSLPCSCLLSSKPTGECTSWHFTLFLKVPLIRSGPPRKNSLWLTPNHIHRFCPPSRGLGILGAIVECCLSQILQNLARYYHLLKPLTLRLSVWIGSQQV